MKKPDAWLVLAYGLPAQATTYEPTAVRWERAGGDVKRLYAEPASTDVVLNESECAMLRDILSSDDGEPIKQLRLQLGEGHSGEGLYASIPDCPDEGSVLLWSGESS